MDNQFIAFAEDEEIRKNDESFRAGWYSLEDLELINAVDDLKDKVKFVLESISKEDVWKKELLLEKN